MSGQERFRPGEVTSEVECHREEVLDLDEVFCRAAEVPVDGPRGGWMCTVSLFVLEDNYALNEEVETEIAFATYTIGDDDVCEITDMEVAKDLRRQGLGGRLLGEVLADIRLKGGTRVFLFAYEPEEGSREEFFSRFGFVPLALPEEVWSARSLPHPMSLVLDDGE
jgi:GNAT superfamily N-acetyltransferase